MSNSSNQSIPLILTEDFIIPNMYIYTENDIIFGSFATNVAYMVHKITLSSIYEQSFVSNRAFEIFKRILKK